MFETRGSFNGLLTSKLAQLKRQRILFELTKTKLRGFSPQGN
jgi:hypothetical protein